MNTYLGWAVVLLSLMVLDQGFALHRLSEFSQMETQFADDYFKSLVECTNKLENQEKK